MRSEGEHEVDITAEDTRVAANNIHLPATTASAVSSAVRADLESTYRVVGRCLRSVAALISSVAAAPVLLIGPLMECNALLGRHPTRDGVGEPLTEVDFRVGDLVGNASPDQAVIGVDHAVPEPAALDEVTHDPPLHAQAEVLALVHGPII
jgi:hypothetical protein